ncbi:MAG: MoxR family ATPase [Bdellovibrio sp.]
MSQDFSQIHQNIQNQGLFVRRILDEVGKAVVGQSDMIEGIIMGLLTGGHVLLEGVPGLAKTLTISSVSRAISLQFNRIQFTPDLLPTDLIGTMIYNPQSGDFSPKKGPVFTNIVLADEVNRAPAKVQSALLEAMAEKQVTIGDTTYPLPYPFLVLATQNPLEQEGTYPLPEAQMDRFMFKIHVGYPTRKDEIEIVNRMSRQAQPQVTPVVTREDLLQAMQAVDSVFVDDKIKNYVVDLVMATRHPQEVGLKSLVPLLATGASPRASLSLIRAGKAHAFLRGRSFVTGEDIKAVALNVLRHRLILTFEAEAEEVSSENIIQSVLSAVEVPLLS